MTAEQLSACIAERFSGSNSAESLCRYVAELSAATRAHGGVELGVGLQRDLPRDNAGEPCVCIP